MKRIQFILVFSFAVILLIVPLAHGADLAEGVATDLQIEDPSVPDGSIVSLTDGKYRLSTTPYDGTVYGVVTENPAVVFKTVGIDDEHSVVTSGKTMVRVATVNGPIKKGDLITSSEIPGVGQKVTENGYVVGVAEEDYTDSDPQRVGLIYTTLHLNYGTVSSGLRENLISSLLQGARAPFSSPINALRYIIAGLIALMSFGVGFWFFFDRLPWLPGAQELGDAWVYPGGAHNNRQHYGQWVRFHERFSEAQQTLCFSPETSGGLLMAVPSGEVEGILSRLEQAWVVGEVVEMGEAGIEVV